MEENYIDKKLKGILESPPDFQPDPLAVQDMQRKLNELPRPEKRRSFLPFLWPLLFLPLFAGAWISYKKYEQLENAYHELNKQITNNQTHTRDSIFIKETIYKFDTIYNVVYKVKYITEEETTKNAREHFYTQSPYPSLLFSSNGLGLSRGLTVQNTGWSLGDNRNSLFAPLPNSSPFYNNSYLTKNNNSTSSNLTNKDEGLANKSSFSFSDPLLLESVPFSFSPSKRKTGILANLDDLIEPVPQERVSRKYYFIPSSFNVGIRTSPSILPTHGLGGSGYSLGLFGAIRFPRNQRLEVGVEYLSMNFELKDADAQNSDFPTVPPNAPTDVLHELKGSFSYLQIPITLRQSFRRNKKFQPMVSAGLVALRPFKYDFKYEYIDGTGEYKLPLVVKNGVFSVDNFRVGIGGEYELRRKLTAGFEVHYQHGVSQGEGAYFPLRYWGLNIGLDYGIW